MYALAPLLGLDISPAALILLTFSDFTPATPGLTGGLAPEKSAVPRRNRRLTRLSPSP
jgi:hypothetical protein